MAKHKYRLTGKKFEKQVESEQVNVPLPGPRNSLLVALVVVVVENKHLLGSDWSIYTTHIITRKYAFVITLIIT